MKKYWFVIIMLIMLIVGNLITYFTQQRFMKIQTNVLLGVLLVFNIFLAKTKK